MSKKKLSPKESRARAAKRGWEARRAREAAEAAQRKARARAAKKGWEKRRASAALEAENKRLRTELRRAKRQARDAERHAVAAEAVADDAIRYRDVLRGKLPVKEYLSKEEYAAAVRELVQLHLREYTPEERVDAMKARWREVNALASKPGQSRYAALLLWAQRNGFQPSEFWAEYRRRSGRGRAA